jgi:hypothetical protein
MNLGPTVEWLGGISICSDALVELVCMGPILCTHYCSNLPGGWYSSAQLVYGEDEYDDYEYCSTPWFLLTA